MRLYRFDDVEVDLSNLRVTVGGEVRQLEPKSFRLLQFLIETRGRAVGKEEILTAVWADTFVTDNALTRAVAQVRKALGDDPKQPRYIETLPTVGYRFLGTVNEDEPVATVIEVPKPAPRFPRRKLWLAAGTAAAALVLASVFLMRETPVAPLGLSMESSQFSTSDGLDVGATFSPDGNLVGYASDRTGSFQIYVKSLDPGARELMLTTAPGQNLYPTFSPDGRAIAFSSLQDPGIWRVPVLGGQVRRLARFGSQPVWSPDGKWIVFRSEIAPSLSTTDYYFPATSSLWLMREDGSGQKQITTSLNPAGGQAFASWSADSEEIRFANYRAGGCEMWAYRIATGGLRKLFGAQPSTGYGSAVFTRGDTAMFYVASRLNGDVGIWEQRLHPRDLSPDGKAQLVYQPSVGTPRDLSLSRNGEHLAYSAVVSESRLLEMKTDGSDPVALTHDKAYRYVHPAYSPDGKYFSYTVLRKGKPPRSVFVPLPDGQPFEIGSDNERQGYGMFTADGKYYYLGSERDGDTSWAIKQVDVKESGAPREVRPLPVQPGRFSLVPDGGAVVYQRIVDGARQLFLASLRDGTEKQLTHGNAEHAYPRISHDGKWICYETIFGGRSDLSLMPVAGPESKEPLAMGTFFVNSWSPDDDKIAYAGFEDGVWNLFWISRTTKEKRQLTRNAAPRVYLRYPVWSPDGKKMAYEFNESKGNVYIARVK